ncbi:MAG: DNA polymerase IV [Acidimicrobiales bacterium]
MTTPTTVGNMVRTILHVDMDAFYAAVEVLADPTLAGRPVVVGGTGARGVVASCSYEARAYGVTSAMPSNRARRLCPSAVFLAGDHRRYADYSRRIHQVFQSFTPLVEGIALDEAFLDTSGAWRLFGDGVAVAEAVRRRVADEVGLTCSVGVAATKFVAKLASRAAKPRATRAGVAPGLGVVVVRPGEELAFLHPLAVSALWGVGPATGARLYRLGVTTVGDLARLPRAVVVTALGASAGGHLHELSWGRDPRRVEPVRVAKSLSAEETYPADIRDGARLARETVRLADSVAARLRGSGLGAGTVTVKIRYGDFRTITRSRSLGGLVDTGPELAAAAQALLAGIDPAPGVRLLGLAATGLGAGPATQLRLGDASAGWGPVSRAVDQARERFGDAAVGPAALLEAGGLALRRQGDQQWGPSR